MELEFKIEDKDIEYNINTYIYNDNEVKLVIDGIVEGNINITSAFGYYEYFIVVNNILMYHNEFDANKASSYKIDEVFNCFDDKYFCAYQICKKLYDSKYFEENKRYFDIPDSLTHEEKLELSKKFESYVMPKVPYPKYFVIPIYARDCFFKVSGDEESINKYNKLIKRPFCDGRESVTFDIGNKKVTVCYEFGD